MRGLGILILVVVFFWLIWPWISRWLKRKASEKAEDYIRSSMGMPPRDRKKKGNAQSQSSTGSSYYQRERRNPFGDHSYGREPIIPKEYAEDVEFTETKDYSEYVYSEKSTDKKETYHESQISDAEWTEVKKSGSK